MKESSPKQGISPGLFLVGLAIAAVAVVAWFDGAEQKRRNPPVATVKAPVAPARHLSPEEKLNHSMLSDSILSIVQSYYVDMDRVDNRKLVRSVIQAINENSDAKLTLRADRVNFTYRGFSAVIPYDASASYQSVLDLFTELAGLVDAYDIEMADVDGSVGAAPSSVKLLNHVLASLDAHSALLSPDAYQELRQGTEGSFGGLGVLVGIRDNLLTVIKPLPRSPAKRAGIQKFDRILGIDGVRTYGFTLDDLVEYMRGDPGTLVNLSLLREGDQAPTDLALRREIIHVDSVTTKDFVTDSSFILQLTIESFSSRTSREVLSAIKKFRRRHGGRLDGLVLDMRANPGGLLDQAVQVVDLFIPKGVIVSTKGRREEIESAGSGFDELGFPMVTLIDGDSASASEIVAGALQDHGRSVILGQPSFGKGSVQTIFELPGERALKLTIARYYTPAGRSIQNIGIMPDLWVQPVYRGEDNINLLGPYRYKNERFLRNHLMVDNQEDRFRWPSLKSYYLTDLSEDGERSLEQDVELAAALKIIRKVNRQYPRMTPANARASHWLALAAPEFEEDFLKIDRQLERHLSKNYKVEWRGKNRGRVTPKITLTSKSLDVVPGETTPIHWQVTNPHPFPIHRVSVFLRAEVAGFETREILVGSIDASSTSAGVMELEAPTYWTESVMKVRVGVAVDAWPADAAAELILNVQHRRLADLTAVASLVNEKGGRLPGRLEEREGAEIQIDLENKGPVDASALTVKLMNLSGQQIEIEGGPVKVERLKQGAVTSLRFPIRGKAKLFSQELGIGLFVESRDLSNPFTHRLSIHAAPTEDIGKAQIIGH